MQEMTIGIMPLEDSAWVRGKCSYKMLLYMSCGLPVVVSPFGMNREVLKLGEVGLAPRSEDEWVDALSWMMEHPDRRAAMGDVGRQVVVDRFGVQAVAPHVARFLRSLV
jgi:glycosyltransferase involved in cell wall biosynthesis